MADISKYFEIDEYMNGKTESEDTHRLLNLFGFVLPKRLSRKARS